MAFKLPKIPLGPRPTRCNLSGLAVLLPAVFSAAISWRTARAQPPAVPPSCSSIPMFAAAQPAVCRSGPRLLGQATRGGTSWGSPAAAGGPFVAPSIAA